MRSSIAVFLVASLSSASAFADAKTELSPQTPVGELMTAIKDQNQRLIFERPIRIKRTGVEEDFSFYQVPFLNSSLAGCELLFMVRTNPNNPDHLDFPAGLNLIGGPHSSTFKGGYKFEGVGNLVPSQLPVSIADRVQSVSFSCSNIEKVGEVRNVLKDIARFQNDAFTAQVANHALKTIEEMNRNWQAHLEKVHRQLQSQADAVKQAADANRKPAVLEPVSAIQTVSVEEKVQNGSGR